MSIILISGSFCSSVVHVEGIFERLFFCYSLLLVLLAIELFSKRKKKTLFVDDYNKKLFGLGAKKNRF